MNNCTHISINQESMLDQILGAGPGIYGNHGMSRLRDGQHISWGDSLTPLSGRICTSRGDANAKYVNLSSPHQAWHYQMLHQIAIISSPTPNTSVESLSHAYIRLLIKLGPEISSSENSSIRRRAWTPITDDDACTIITILWEGYRTKEQLVKCSKFLK